MVCTSNLSRGKRFFSSPKCPDWLWGPPSLLFNGHGGLFPQELSRWDMRLTTHICLFPRIRSGAILPHPIYVFIVCVGNTLLPLLLV